MVHFGATSDDFQILLKDSLVGVPLNPYLFNKITEVNVSEQAYYCCCEYVKRL